MKWLSDNAPGILVLAVLSLAFGTALGDPPSPAKTSTTVGRPYSKEEQMPAPQRCGTVTVPSNEGNVQVPRSALFRKQCKLVTITGADGAVLSQHEECGMLAFVKCN